MIALRARRASLVTFLIVAGCAGPGPDGDTDGGPDGECTTAASCDDGVFCNGAERCAPGAADADLRGCAPADTPACGAGESCDETAEQCMLDCVDSDRDGAPSSACGGDDCDDDDPARYPGAAEVCDGDDEDCDPDTVGERDTDGDGFASNECCNTGADDTLVCGADCDDAVRAVNPDASDPCDTVDNDCDLAIDEGGTIYADVDNDGRGDPATSMAGMCMVGWVFNGDDCDDLRSETYEGARELCDGRDNDCSLPGAMAGGAESSEDADGDGHSSLAAMCVGRGEPGAPGFAFAKDDCDDASATTYTGAAEICGNGLDEDCDRVIDNPTQMICTDADGDGWGDDSTRSTILSCVIPSGSVHQARCSDCNDAQPLAFPSNREICDRIDNDCSSGGGPDLSEDDDGDGYAPSTGTCAGRGEADVPSTALPRTDCNDSSIETHPGAMEICDRLDHDCSSGGTVALDEDGDDDGHAPIGGTCRGREEGGPVTSFFEDDCDDTQETVHAGVLASTDYALCDGLDNDCTRATSEVTREEGCTFGRVCGMPAAAMCGASGRVVQLALSSGLGCALIADGRVVCWGPGSGARAPITGLANVVSLDAGSFDTCAVRADGTVACISGGVSTDVPVITDAIGVAVGSAHKCALRAGGTVMCWGQNTHGQIGDGGSIQRPNPVVVPLLEGVTQIAAGTDHTCALLTDATVRCWGRNTEGSVGDGGTSVVRTPTAVAGLTGVRAVTAGGNHSCALLTAGGVRCWGANGSGELGDGSTTARSTPVAVSSLSSIVAIGAGWTHTCALSAAGAVSCWGEGGRVGDGTTVDRTVPTLLAGLTATRLDVSFDATCARDAQTVWRCWGINASFELGDGTNVDRPAPVVVPHLGRASSISAGTHHSCATRADGSVWCWGDGESGQLGDGTSMDRLTPTLVTLSSVVEVAAGSGHTCARLSDGTLRCWGTGTSGQLGDGTSTDRSSPVVVSGSSMEVQIVTSFWSGDLSCARRMDGTVRCWGDNSSGSLGDGTTTPRSVPTLVTGLTGAVDIAVGRFHGCAARVDGTVMCWGNNSDGQLGDGTTTDHPTPAIVPGLTGVVEIEAGGTMTCARRTDGTVHCWGSNDFGQLGDGTLVARSTPGPVSGVTGAQRLALGYLHGCATRTDGSLMCWGYNGRGQLGDGTLTHRPTPITVPGITGVSLLATGYGHTCATLADESLLCWGRNPNGQLGDGLTATERPTPDSVLGF